MTISVVADADDTTVSLSPSSQTVSSEDIFNVNVSCVPGEPIKAWEFRLSFNPSLLQVNSVTEGNIFSGYNTYFKSGTIDNNAGTITDIYNLINESGNVSDSGTFVTISFTAKDPSGTSSLDINDVGVTDEVGYVSIEVSDGSITVQGTNPPSPPMGPSEGGTEQNNSPDEPVKPSGPTFVELGVEYVYTSSAVDPDGDDIRYRFDWGDGNYSNWSEFVESNALVSMSHSWTSISTFEIMVMAQDENGQNSSWSLPLNVTVSAIDFEGEPPVADFFVPSNLSTNQTIFFDASGSFDEDGVIVSYNWDFGDGENGNGATPSHIYKNPGKYTVTLAVTDNNGNTYSKSIVVTVVVSEVEEEQSGGEQSVLTFDLGSILIGFAMLMLICLAVFFRDYIKSFVSSYSRYIHLFSYWKIWDASSRIKRIDAKIDEIEKMRAGKADFEQSPIIKANKDSYGLQEEFLRSRRYIDFMSKLPSKEKKSSDEFDKTYSGEKIDKLPMETRDSETFTDSDFRSTIDALPISERRKNLEKIDIEKVSKVYESDKRDIERQVDNYIISKTRKKIDDL